MPSDAELRVKVLDKDDGAKDDFIGKFTTDIQPGAKEGEILGHLHRNRGTFWLKVGDSGHSPHPVADPSQDRKYTLERPVSRTAQVHIRWPHPVFPPFLPYRRPSDEH